MRIFMTGGTGFLGSILIEKLTSLGHKITILTRSLKRGITLPEGASFLQGDPTQPGPWQTQASDHEATINLAGASIFRRWNKRAKQEILHSRVLTTQNIVNAIRQREGEKTLLLNASAVGIYGFHGDEILDESSPPADDFLSTVVFNWEKEARKAKESGARVTLCRFGLVLGKKGGVLIPMHKAFEVYLGSSFGTGKQWFSWIHEEDLTEIILFLLEHEELEGPINCTSPNPVRNEELTKTLSKVLGKPMIFPKVPSFFLKLILGELAETILHGQRVLPRKLLSSGFHHKFPDLRGALENLLEE